MSALPRGLVSRLKWAHRLTNFVETGCHLGDGVQIALEAGFERVWSCDIAEHFAQHCRDRFSTREEVTIDTGNSLTCLSDQLEKIEGNVLFWLDGHYPAFYGMADRESDRTRFPIASELEVIHRKRHGAREDVILIDDIRVLEAEDNPRWRPGEVPDYFKVAVPSIASLVEAFDSTHAWKVECDQEGILVLTPRQLC